MRSKWSAIDLNRLAGLLGHRNLHFSGAEPERQKITDAGNPRTHSHHIADGEIGRLLDLGIL